MDSDPKEALRKQNGSSSGFNVLNNYVLTHQKQGDEWRDEVQANPEKAWVVKAGLHMEAAVARNTMVFQECA